MTQRILGTILLWAGLIGPAAGQPPDDFLKRIPDKANGVSVIDVAALYNSPRGKREGWAKEEMIAGSVPLPSFVTTLLTASHWKPGSTQWDWVIVQAALNRRVSMKDLAAQEKSQVETLAGFNVVLTKRRGYFVELNPRTVGAVHPPHRQDVLHWLRLCKSANEPKGSPYLLEAVKTAGDAHIVGALDMEALVDPVALKEWLTHSSTLQQRKNELDAIAEFANKLKGVRLAIKVEDQSIAAEVRFDFDDHVERYASLVKPLFLEVLNDLRAALDDFQNAQVTHEGKTVRLRTTLKDRGLAAVLSGILGPTLHAEQDTAATETPGPNAELLASRKYYQQIQKLLSDLQDMNRLATNYNMTAWWHESAAKQIDQLPLTNVDPGLVKYGAEVASKLRLLASSLRGVPLELKVLEGQKRWVALYTPPTYGGYGYGGWGRGWGGWGGYQPGSLYYDDNFQAVRTRQQQTIVAGATDRDKIWRELEDARSAIRIQLSQKFMAEFDTKSKN